MATRNKPEDIFKYIDLNPVPPSTCWLWTAGLSSKGIPYYSIDGKKVIAYRHVYKLVNPDWDINNRREVIRHMCKDMNGNHVDNPLCCNPSHMLPGTHEQNMLDVVLRGRSGLTIDAVRDIIKLHNEIPSFTQKQIADRVAYKHKINIARQTVTDLLRGARHKELRDELDRRDRELTEKKDG